MEITTTEDRSFAAELRAVEEGHRAFLGHDAKGSFVRIVSDILGHTGKAWIVRTVTAGPGQPVLFDCDPQGQTRDGHRHIATTDGRTTCKHMALAARRLVREGLATAVTPGAHGDIVTRDTRYLATEKGAPAPVAPPANDDPFAGFPK